MGNSLLLRRRALMLKQSKYPQWVIDAAREWQLPIDNLYELWQRYNNIEGVFVPDDYGRYMAIYSNGSAYILTDIIPDLTTKFRAQLRLLVTKDGHFFGARDLAKVGSGYAFGVVKNAIVSDFFGSRLNFMLPATDYSCVIKSEGKVVTINGERAEHSDADITELGTSRKFVLMGLYNQNVSNPWSADSAFRYVEIIQDDVRLFLIPFINEQGKTGFVDVFSKRGYYPNSLYKLTIKYTDFNN